MPSTLITSCLSRKITPSLSHRNSRPACRYRGSTENHIQAFHPQDVTHLSRHPGQDINYFLRAGRPLWADLHPELKTYSIIITRHVNLLNIFLDVHKLPLLATHSIHHSIRATSIALHGIRIYGEHCPAVIFVQFRGFAFNSIADSRHPLGHTLLSMVWLEPHSIHPVRKIIRKGAVAAASGSTPTAFKASDHASGRHCSDHESNRAPRRHASSKASLISTPPLASTAST